MYDINYTVSKSLMVRSTPWYPVGGSVGIYRAVFAFSPEWDGLVKTAVFRSAAAEREQLLDENNSCIVPWEPLQMETGWLEVGVYGVDGTTKHPTYWDASVPIGPGPGKSNPAQEPSPDKWQQYVDELKDTVPEAVEEYLDEHPATVEEVDPTVPAWAKAPEKPAYTAQEVGALPDDTEIPTVPTKVSAFANDAGYLTEHQDLESYAKKTDIPAKLPNPTPLEIVYPDGTQLMYTGAEARLINLATGFKNPFALTFAGGATGSYDGSVAKTVNIPTELKSPNALTFTGAVTGSYDGSEPKTVNIPEGGDSGLPPSTASDAGKFLRVGEDGGPWWENMEIEKIGEVALEEEAVSIELDLPGKYNVILVKDDMPPASGKGQLRIWLNNVSCFAGPEYISDQSVTYSRKRLYAITRAKPYALAFANGKTLNGPNQYDGGLGWSNYTAGPFETFKYGCLNGTVPLPAGTKIEVWGIKA